MAEQTLTVKFVWENEGTFKMNSKLNENESITVCQSQENGNFNKLWDNLKGVCMIYVENEVDKIGDEMKG